MLIFLSDVRDENDIECELQTSEKFTSKSFSYVRDFSLSTLAPRIAQ